MIELLKPYDFASFFELFQVIEKSALAGEKEIHLERVTHKRTVSGALKGKVAETLTLDIEYIKARAFEELYERLPPADLWDSVAALCTIGQLGRFPDRAEKMLAAVKNIPTK